MIFNKLCFLMGGKGRSVIIHAYALVLRIFPGSAAPPRMAHNSLLSFFFFLSFSFFLFFFFTLA